MVGVLSQEEAPPCLTLAAKLSSCSESHSLSVLIDSEAEQNFIDCQLAHQLGLQLEPLPQPIRIMALSGQRLPDITLVTEPVELTLSGNHS